MSSLRLVIKNPGLIVWDFALLHNYSLEGDKTVRDNNYQNCMSNNFAKHTGQTISYDQIMTLVNKSADVKHWYKLYKMESSLFMSILDGYNGLGLEKDVIKKLNDDWVSVKEARIRRAETIRTITENAQKQVTAANNDFRNFTSRVDPRCLVNLVREDHILFERELELQTISDPDDREKAIRKEIIEIKKRVLLENSPGYTGEVLYPISLLLF